MSNPLQISVVIPAYNSEGFVARAIESIQRQTYPVLEILVVDDGSKDRTAEVAAACGPTVRVIRQPNGGPAAARNHGVRESKGDWIALLDADDTWLPNKLEKQVAALQPDTDLVHTFCIIDPSAAITPEVINFESLWRKNVIGTSTVLMKKSVFQAAGGFDEDRSIMAVEDYNLWLRMVHRGAKVLTLREALCDYTPAPGNLSGQLDRMIRSELNNVEKIRVACGLSAEQIRRKQIQIYEEWGLSMFHAREMLKARDCYGQILARKVKMSALGHWLATFVPVPVLDFRRTLKGNQIAPETCSSSA